jgi:probable HAF family extracellular repeat protein
MKLSAALPLLVLAVWSSGQVGRADPINFTFTTLDVPGARFTSLNGINDAGQIVGSYAASAESVGHGFLYDSGAFTTIDAFDARYTQLSGINSGGQIVGTFFETNTGIPHAFKVDSGGVTVLDLPGNGVNAAYGINNLGQIVGYFFDNTGLHGFLDTNGRRPRWFSSLHPFSNLRPSC